MPDRDFRYDLSAVPPYFAEYYRAYNDWQDAIARIPPDEYERQIISRDHSVPAWLCEHEYMQRRTAALDNMSIEQVAELLYYAEQSDKMILSAYLMRRHRQQQSADSNSVPKP